MILTTGLRARFFMANILFALFGAIIAFSLVSPVRFLPDVVAFKSALFSLSITAGSIIYFVRDLETKISVNILKYASASGLVVPLFWYGCAAYTGINNSSLILFASSAIVLGSILSFEKRSGWLLIGILNGGTLLAAFATLSWHGIFITSEVLQLYIPIDQQGSRAQSGLGQSNNFGVLAITCVWLIWGALFRHESKGALKFIGWMLILILLQGVFVSYSRTAVLGFVLATLYLLGMSFQFGFRKIQWRHGLPLVAYIAVVVVYRWIFDGDARAASVEGFARGDVGRIRMWEMAIEAIVEKPFFGWGLGTIPSIALDKSVTYGAFDYSILTHFHNTPLDFLVQFGLVGGGVLIVFFVYLLILAWRGSRNIQNGDVLFAAGIPLLVHAMLEYPFSYGFLFWPFCVWLGYLISFSSTRVVGVPRVVALPIGMAVLSFWYVWYSSYLRVESLYTQVRQGYQVSAEMVEKETYSFEDLFFRHYIDRLKWVVEPVTPQTILSESQLIELDRVSKVYPTDLLLWKNAVARASLGDLSGAAWWAERMCRMYEPKVCEQAAIAWRSIDVKGWPALHWDLWRQKMGVSDFGSDKPGS
jgi:O-antigen ligase